MEDLTPQSTQSFTPNAVGINAESTSKKSLYLFSIVFLVACSASAVGGYLLGQKGNSKTVITLNSAAASPTPISSPSSSPVTERETPPQPELSTKSQESQAGWKTYTDPRFGFSFQYPSDSKTASRDPDPFPVAIQLENLRPRTGGGGGPEMVGWIMIISEPQPNPQKLSLRAWAQATSSLQFEADTKADELIIDKKKAIRWIPGVPFGFKSYLLEKTPTEVISIVVNHGGLSEGLETDLFDQILSTWKF